MKIHKLRNLRISNGLQLWMFYGIFIYFIISENFQSISSSPSNSCSTNKNFNKSIYKLLFNDSNSKPGMVLTTENSEAFKLKSCPSLRHQCCLHVAENFYMTTRVRRYLNSLSGISLVKQDFVSLQKQFLVPFTAFTERYVIDLRTYFQAVNLRPSITNPILGQLYLDLIPAITTHANDYSHHIRDSIHDFYRKLTAALISGQTGQSVETLAECFTRRPAVYWSLDFFRESKKVRDLSDAMHDSLRELAGIVFHINSIIEIFSKLEEFPITESCIKALARMHLCAACSGHTASMSTQFTFNRPLGHLQDSYSDPSCPKLCMNVVRGCLAPTIRLRAAWDRYARALETFIGILVKEGPALSSAFDVGVFKMAFKEGLKRNKKLNTKTVKKVLGMCRTDRSSPPLGPSLPFMIHNTALSEAQIAFDLQRVKRTQIQRLYTFQTHLNRWKDFFNNEVGGECYSHPVVTCWNGAEMGQYHTQLSNFDSYGQLHNPAVSVTEPELTKLTQTLDLLMSLGLDVVKKRKDLEDRLPPPMDYDYGGGSFDPPVGKLPWQPETEGSGVGQGDDEDYPSLPGPLPENGQVYNPTLPDNSKKGPTVEVPKGVPDDLITTSKVPTRKSVLTKRNSAKNLYIHWQFSILMVIMAKCAYYF